MRHKVVPPICRLEDLRPEKSSAFFRFSRHSPWSPASADFGSLHTKKRICLQQTYPLRSHSKKTSVLYPYVGIIQIRLRVRAIQPTLSLLCASSPFLYSFYSSTLFRFLQGGCPIFLYFFAEILCRPAKAGQADGSFFWRIGIRTRSSNQPSWVVMVAVPPYLAAVFWMLLTPKPW